jgi:hypothetical protein
MWLITTKNKMALPNASPRQMRRGGVTALTFLIGLLLNNTFAQDLLLSTTPHTFASDTKECNNFVKIGGKTNVNHFHLIQKLNGQEEIVERSQETLTLRIPADEFEPSNPMMYEDFLDFIKADEYPEIDITIFLDNTRLPAGNSNHISPRIKIGLAGQTKTYTIPGKIEECRDNSLHISGKVNINLHDFNLEPPSKFMGIVKVSKEVFINFELTLEL